jgi:hypothetical protein
MNSLSLSGIPVNTEEIKECPNLGFTNGLGFFSFNELFLLQAASYSSQKEVRGQFGCHFGLFCISGGFKREKLFIVHYYIRGLDRPMYPYYETQFNVCGVTWS